jgi:hypothetical protein
MYNKTWFSLIGMNHIIVFLLFIRTQVSVIYNICNFQLTPIYIVIVIVYVLLYVFLFLLQHIQNIMFVRLKNYSI